jgi:hypothetical protein
MGRLKRDRSKIKAAAAFPVRFFTKGVRLNRHHHFNEQKPGEPTFDVDAESAAVAQEGRK